MLPSVKNNSDNFLERLPAMLNIYLIILLPTNEVFVIGDVIILEFVH